MKKNLGRCIPPRWYYGSVDPINEFGLEEDVFINIIEKKILIKLQNEENQIVWQEFIHNIPVLNPEEILENENIIQKKYLSLYSDVINDFDIEKDLEIEYIKNPEYNKWYKKILIGFNDETQENIYGNLYYIEENSEEDLLIKEINNLDYKINGTVENSKLNLIIDETINANLTSINDLNIFGYAENFIICSLQNNGISSGLIFNFEELWKNDSWKNNHNFTLLPHEIKIYNNKYRIREYTL